MKYTKLTSGARPWAMVSAGTFCTLLLVGCSDDDTGCRRREDCPPGHACVLGECRPDVTTDGGLDAGPDAARDAGPDGSLDAGGSDGGLCEYVDDGVVQRSELVFEVGLGATYRVNADAPVAVDVVGQPAGGQTLWDFTGTTPSDHSVVDELLPASGAWWSADFPDATYSAWLDESLGTLGVFRVTPDALQMLGIVSDTPNQTLLTYAPPVDLLRFPLQSGTQWLQETTSSGTYNYTMTTLEETYDVLVDAEGTVVVPAGSFHALRVRTRFEQHIPFTLIYTTRVLYLWVTECFGIVARISSEDNEPELLFTQAAEYRRMTL